VKSCIWTCTATPRFVSGMNEDVLALIRQLCTRAGCIMEDTSVVALIWNDGLSIEARLAKLSAAADDIQAIIAAARTLTSA
jgi:hypothetical protein